MFVDVVAEHPVQSAFSEVDESSPFGFSLGDVLLNDREVVTT